MIQRLKKFFNTEDKSDLDMNEQERMLAAYFDGELSPAEAEAFRRQNTGVDSIENELESMGELRSAFRDLVDDMYLQTNQGSGKTSIWQQIESRIRQEAQSRISNIGNSSNFSSSGLVEFLRPFFEPRAAFAGAAGLAMAFMFGVRFGSSDISNQLVYPKASRVNLASNTSNSNTYATTSVDADLFPTSPVSPNPGFAVVSAASSSRDSSIRLKVARDSGLRNSTGRRVSEHSIPLRVDTDQLIGVPSDQSINGGLRTQGADIDWIESDRKFKILPVNEKRVVPVIWVSRENRK